ncbi:MAG: hypothetical protein DMF67_02360 [Acidobacteria bacterium]|nr:MAG: hypothetical protein DMF66_05250 [Acidobacteriota bacterium]PYS85118.1 MAG: hypothetical protein DMF67_02360 [Acidobacteriota bacterium]
MPSVSVVITTHDRPHLLRRAVESARAAGESVEVVVVDDASTDETAEVCASIPNIRYVRIESNRRVAGARNVGLLACAGEYLSFLDDDDLRLPGSLDSQVALLESQPEAGMVYGQALVVDQTGAQSGRPYPASCPRGDVFWQLLRQNFVPCGSAVFRRSCLYRVGLLDDTVPGLDDWDLWIRIAELYPVATLEKPVSVWRRSSPASGQGTSQAAALVARCRRQWLERWMMLPRALDATRPARREAWRHFSANMANHLVCETGRALACGRFGQAALSASAALRLFPLEVARAPFDRARVRAVLGRLQDKWSALEARS